MLTYKAELVGITVLVTEESYTSKASFLDGDQLPVRTKRSAFWKLYGIICTMLNADEEKGGCSRYAALQLTALTQYFYG
jgi:hypothetical protein